MTINLNKTSYTVFKTHQSQRKIKENSLKMGETVLQEDEAAKF